MPAIRIGEGSELAQQPEPFRNEYELQEILAGHPVLLVDRDDSALVTICREFPLGNGFADIVLIDSNGLPVIVEVKLARNGESRRKIIGQLCDSLSAMRNLTPDEVNERSAGLLEEILQSMAGVEGGEENPADRLALVKSNVASYLRAGQIRGGIIVLDAAPDDLIREFSYLNEHSDLDLRLLVVERYRLGRHEYFYHSRFLVSGEVDPEMKGGQRLRLRSIVEKFSKMKLPIFSTHATGMENVRVYREGWPAAVHYEFDDRGGIPSASRYRSGTESTRRLRTSSPDSASTSPRPSRTRRGSSSLPTRPGGRGFSSSSGKRSTRTGLHSRWCGSARPRKTSLPCCRKGTDRG